MLMPPKDALPRLVPIRTLSCSVDVTSAPSAPTQTFFGVSDRSKLKSFSSPSHVAGIDFEGYRTRVRTSFGLLTSAWSSIT
jgi:hypothetical protein